MTERPALRIGRILLVVVPVAVLGLGAYLWSKTLEPAAQSELADNVFAKIITTNVVTSKMGYADKDNDLIADPPEDATKTISPEVIKFSAVESESVSQEAWNEVIAAIAEKTGRKVEYFHFASVNEQLEALNKGELHVAALNTGIVPAAVQRGGFVPLCTFGNDDGKYQITMQLIVPADSKIKQLADLKGKKIAFTRPDSNSGCKLLLMLLKDQGMSPERDYQWGMSTSHEKSIKGVADKDYDAAPVSSDILERMIKSGEVKEDSIRVAYESERFPPATIGYVYNLAPELREGIRAALVGFDLTGTKLEGQFGAEANKLVPVDYKNDWATARRIDQLAMNARKGQ